MKRIAIVSTVFILFFAVFAMAGVNDPAEESTVRQGPIDDATATYRYISINTAKGALQIDVQTGGVIIPDGLDVDDAAKEFWAAVENTWGAFCPASDRENLVLLLEDVLATMDSPDVLQAKLGIYRRIEQVVEKLKGVE